MLDDLSVVTYNTQAHINTLHPCRLKDYTFISAVVRSHSYQVRGVQSPPGQSGDGIPGFLLSGPPGSGAGALPD